MLLTAVTAEGVENSCMGCIYLKIASAVLEEVLECAWERPFAWGLMQQGCHLWKLARKRCSCGEIENLEWKVTTIEVRVYLVFILCIYPGSHFLFFLSKLLVGFMASCIKKPLLMVTPYTRLPHTMELLEVMPLRECPLSSTHSPSGYP